MSDRIKDLEAMVMEYSAAMASRDKHIRDAAHIFESMMGYDDTEEIVAWLARPEVKWARRC